MVGAGRAGARVYPPSSELDRRRDHRLGRARPRSAAASLGALTQLSRPRRLRGRARDRCGRRRADRRSAARRRRPHRRDRVRRARHRRSSAPSAATCSASGRTSRCGGSTSARSTRSAVRPSRPLGALLSAWLVAGLFTQSSVGWLARPIQHSAVLTALDAVMPPVPSVIARAQAFLSTEVFPVAFAAVTQPTTTSVQLPTSAATAARSPGARRRVGAEGRGLGRLRRDEGRHVASSSRPASSSPNAHVVAGEPHARRRRRPRGASTRRSSCSTPSLDVALLRVDGPRIARRSALDAAIAPTGPAGAVVGFPGGGPEDAPRRPGSPARSPPRAATSTAGASSTRADLRGDRLGAARQLGQPAPRQAARRSGWSSRARSPSRGWPTRSAPRRSCPTSREPSHADDRRRLRRLHARIGGT